MKKKALRAFVALAAIITSASVSGATDCTITRAPKGSFAAPLLCESPGDDLIATAWVDGNAVKANLNGGNGFLVRTRGYNSSAGLITGCVAEDTDNSSGTIASSGSCTFTVVYQDLYMDG